MVDGEIRYLGVLVKFTSRERRMVNPVINLDGYGKNRDL